MSSFFCLTADALNDLLIRRSNDDGDDDGEEEGSPASGTILSPAQKVDSIKNRSERSSAHMKRGLFSIMLMQALSCSAFHGQTVKKL